MLFMASNLTKRGDVYYFRARIPTHLVSAYGREIVSLSLRTTDQRVAKERAREHAVALDRALRALEQEARPDADFAGTVLHLSDEDIEGLCLRYRAKVLAADELSRIQGMSAADVEAEREIYEGALVSQRDAYARGDLGQVYPAVREFLKSLNLRVPGQSPAFERLARAFQRADIEVNEAVLQRRSGVAVPVPLSSQRAASHMAMSLL